MQMKITDLCKSLNKNSYSFELTPNCQLDKLKNLKSEPLFYSIIWHANKINFQLHNIDLPPIVLAKKLLENKKNVLLHLSCDNLSLERLNTLLECFMQIGIRNLFIIQGERFDSNRSHFKVAKELLKYIRKITGNYFCIGVAGYPDCNLDEMKYLKDKIDSGADFIITQACFDWKYYVKFYKNCKECKIEKLIIFGAFLFNSCESLNKFAHVCRINIGIEKPPQNTEQCEEFLNQMLANIARSLNTTLIFHWFTIDQIENLRIFLNL